MMHEAIAITSKNASEIEAVRRGRPRLVGPHGEDIKLPQSLHTLLKGAVRTLVQGRSVVLIPQEKQLTTQQAGDLLGVSRPYLIRLLDAGEMAYSLVGRHRRIALRDVIAYAKRNAARKSALDQMARDATRPDSTTVRPVFRKAAGTNSDTRMRNRPVAVLDACVLIPMPLADTLLRLAEPPSIFEARWSDEILAEVTRVLVRRFGKSRSKAR